MLADRDRAPTCGRDVLIMAPLPRPCSFAYTKVVFGCFYVPGGDALWSAPRYLMPYLVGQADSHAACRNQHQLHYGHTRGSYFGCCGGGEGLLLWALGRGSATNLPVNVRQLPRQFCPANKRWDIMRSVQKAPPDRCNAACQRSHRHVCEVALSDSYTNPNWVSLNAELVELPRSIGFHLRVTWVGFKLTWPYPCKPEPRDLQGQVSPRLASLAYGSSSNGFD